MVPPKWMAMKVMKVEVMKAMMIEVMAAEVKVVEVVTNLMIGATNARINAIAAPKMIQSAGKLAESVRKICLEVITNLMKAMVVEVIVVEVIVAEVKMIEVMMNLMKEAKDAKIFVIAVVEIGGA